MQQLNSEATNNSLQFKLILEVHLLQFQHLGFLELLAFYLLQDVNNMIAMGKQQELNVLTQIPFMTNLILATLKMLRAAVNAGNALQEVYANSNLRTYIHFSLIIKQLWRRQLLSWNFSHCK